MRGRTARELLTLPVRLRGIQLGRPVDLLVDVPSERVLGVEVLCGDEVHRFLPISAVTIRSDELTVSSALTMLEEAELAFYRERGATLSALRGAELLRDGRPAGRLRDVVVGEGGAIAAVLVDDDGEVPPDGLAFASASAA
jgi:hypothetical protein